MAWESFDETGQTFWAQVGVSVLPSVVLRIVVSVLVSQQRKTTSPSAGGNPEGSGVS